MTILEESKSPAAAGQPDVTAPAGTWIRHLIQAPRGAAWVAESVAGLAAVPSLPPLRELRAEADGSWSAEEFVSAGHQPLAVYLTNTAAPVWVFVSIVQQCLAGLSGLHAAGLLHGAISPSTLRIDASGSVRLAGVGATAVVPDWFGAEAAESAPALRQALAAADLRDLGRTFRAVLGGDAEARMTMTRPDIAPLVAEWIDWLCDPPEGREPAGAAEAESIFSDIRAGRPGVRPWHEPEQTESWQPDMETAKGKRRRMLVHGLGMEWRGLVVLGLMVLGLLTGGIWALSHFLASAGKGTEAAQPVPAAGVAIPLPEFGSDEPVDGGSDLEPVAGLDDLIAGLLDRLKEGFPEDAKWEAALKRQKEERERLAAGEDPASVLTPVDYLDGPGLFPALGKPGGGRVPGDYYLVWRTARLVMTPEETRALQAAVLRCARYCGVRLMAWTVLPNQAAVVIRVMPRKPLPDEKLQRRIAVLRGEAAAARVIGQIDAKLKEGDRPGADRIREQWTASMGSAAGFFSVITRVPIADASLLRGYTLWQDKPLRMALLDPASAEVVKAAGIVDLAAVKAELVRNPSDWPLCGLSAARHQYGPAIRAISVLMQPDPQDSLPLPPKEDLLNAIRLYRRRLGDLPAETVTTPVLLDAGEIPPTNPPPATHSAAPSDPATASTP